MHNFISEDQIESRTIDQCKNELHYDEHFNCYSKDYLQRESEREVLCKTKLRQMIARLNRSQTNLDKLDEGDIDRAVAALTTIDPLASAEAVNMK